MICSSEVFVDTTNMISTNSCTQPSKSYSIFNASIISQRHKPPHRSSYDHDSLTVDTACASVPIGMCLDGHVDVASYLPDPVGIPFMYRNNLINLVKCYDSGWKCIIPSVIAMLRMHILPQKFVVFSIKCLLELVAFYLDTIRFKKLPI